MVARRLLRAAALGLCAAAVAVAGAAGAGAAGSAVPDDLRLGETGAAWLRVETHPNPHGAIPCTGCHVRGGVTYENAVRFGMVLPLVTEGEGSILLCEKCHQDYHEIHPVNFPVRRLLDAVERAGVFPLESPLEGYYKLTCTSCHAVHFPHAANRLLRGYPVDVRTGDGPFLTRLDFCGSCHGREQIASFSGHDKAAGEAGCGLCHGTRIDPEVVGPLKQGLNGTCSFCHPPEPGAPPHYAEYNPFPGLAPEALQAAGVELLRARYTCATCHRHHRPARNTPFFKPGFVAAVVQSYLVNPHRSSRFCLNCHTGNPPPPGTPGAAAPLIETDVTRLCQRCHEREGALRMHHPLTVPSAAAAVPDGWPLREGGALGCGTCHLAGHGPRDPANPQFLRGGAYTQRNDVCHRCHDGEREPNRDIHAEIAANLGCDFCHERPEPGVDPEQRRVGALRAEPNLLCLRCHAAPPHPASAVHTVRPRPTGFLQMDESCTPLTLGKVTCHTCHDSHGVGATAAFLRLRAQQPVCTNCHPF